MSYACFHTQSSLRASNFCCCLTVLLKVKGSLLCIIFESCSCGSYSVGHWKLIYTPLCHFDCFTWMWSCLVSLCGHHNVPPFTDFMMFMYYHAGILRSLGQFQTYICRRFLLLSIYIYMWERDSVREGARGREGDITHSQRWWEHWWLLFGSWNKASFWSFGTLMVWKRMLKLDLADSVPTSLRRTVLLSLPFTDFMLAEVCKLV